jgi:uncharacterized protein YdhG (YjbR/CyaY superfamily)
MQNITYTSTDEYIASFPADVQGSLQSLRSAIREAAPDAVEAISYQMPTYKLNGKNLVHFAAYKNHIGFYPSPSAILHFAAELTPYKSSKGAVQFPVGQPLPLPLIQRMVAFRLQEESKK